MYELIVDSQRDDDYMVMERMDRDFLAFRSKRDRPLDVAEVRLYVPCTRTVIGARRKVQFLLTLGVQTLTPKIYQRRVFYPIINRDSS